MGVTPVSVVQLVREVMADLAPVAQPRALSLSLSLGDGAMEPIASDRGRLRELLTSLIGNAISSTTSGGVTVSVTSAARNGSRQWRIDVTDSGIGIPPERHADLFEPPLDAVLAGAPDSGISGLGLPLLRRLAQELNGALVLLGSEPGRSTTFRLTLDSRSLGHEPEAESSQPAGTVKLGSGLRVLLADDHPDMVTAVSMLLGLEGISVASARNGREAVARALGEPFDVVLMDLHMPHMDGLSATRELRLQGCRVPVIALTADAPSIHRSDALAAGCDAILGKPFDVSDLLATLRALREKGGPP